MSSEPNEPVEAASPTASSDETPKSETRERKPRRLWRWTKRLVLFALLLVVVARFALPPLLPRLLEGPLAARGLALDWERLDLSLLGGHVALQHVDLWSGERGDGPPVDGSGLAHIEFMVADIDVSALFGGKLVVHRLEVDGADLRFERDAEGRLDWVEALAGGDAGEDDEAEPEDDGPRGLLDALPEDLNFPIALGAARLQHVRLTFVDRASNVRVPTTELQLRLSDVGHGRRTGRFSFSAASSGLLDRLRVEGPVRLVEHAAAAPEEDPTVGLDIDLELELLGLRPGTLAPLLAELGIEARADTLDANGALGLSVGPGRRVALVTRNLSLRADGEVAASLEDVEFVAEQAETGGVLELSTARVSRGDVFAAREAQGAVVFAGLAFVGAPATAKPEFETSEPATSAGAEGSRAGEPEPEVVAESPEEPSESGPLPRIRLPELRLSGLNATFDDRASAPPTQLVAQLEELSLRKLELGNDAPPPVRLELLAHLPGVLADLRASGDLEPFAERPRARLDFGGEGLDLDALEPYLSAAGVQSLWENGQVRGQLDVNSRREGEQLVLGAEITDLHLGSEALGEVAGLESLSVSGLRALPDGLELDALQLAGATLPLELDPEGPWRALGLISAPPSAMDDPTAAEREPRYESLGIRGGSLALNDLRLGPDALSAGISGKASLGDWIEAFEWNVQLSGSPEALQADLDVNLQGWSGATLARLMGAPAPGVDTPGSARLRGRVAFGQADGRQVADARFENLEVLAPPLVAGTAPRLAARVVALDLELRNTGEGQRLTVAHELTGLDAGEWAGYLPPGVDLDLRDARWSSSMTADIDSIELPAVEAGESTAALPAEVASALHLEVARTGLFAADGTMQLGFDGLEVNAPLLAARELSLDRVALRGGRLRANRDAEGVLHLPGLSITPVEAEPGAPPTSAESDGEADGVAVSGRGELPPLVRLGALELELAELRFEDALAPDAEPLVLNAAVRSDAPWTIYDHDAEDQADLPMAVTFGVAPALQSGRVDLQLALFDDRPQVRAAVLLEGLSAEGALALAPDLAERMRPTELVDGVFRAELGAALDLRRRGPLDFDLTQGFGFELEVRDVELRGAPEAEPLLGLGALRVEASKLQPSTGDFRIRSIEIQRPQARVARRPEGFELAGVLLKLATPPVEASGGFGEPDAAGAPVEVPAEASGAAEGETVAAAAPESTPPAQPADPAAGSSASGSDTAAAPASTAAATQASVTANASGAEANAVRLAVDEVIASGLDLRFEDTTGSVPMIVPLNELDFELRGLDTGAPTKPIRFNLLLGSGKVALPERAPEQNLVSGIAGFAVNVLEGAPKKERALVERKVFEEIAVSGQIQLEGPEDDGLPTGWTQVNVVGLELLAARGPAGAAGVTITDGVLDLTAKARLRGAEGMRLNTKTTLGSLSLSEPADGPISRWLKLPAPLDSVVFLLKDNAGEVTLPFDVSIAEKGISLAQVTGQVVSALTQVIATAVASSPLRVAGGLTDFLGLGGGGETAPKLEEFSIEFPVGLDLLTPDQVGRIALVAQRFRNDKQLVGVVTHVLGPGDLQRAEALGNPSPDARQDLWHRLAARRQELERERTELAAEIRSQWLVGLTEEAEASRRRLQLLDAELLAAENALDRVLELLSPRAERNRARRTREIALAMAELRIAELQRRLDEVGLPADIDERLRIQLPRFEVDESLPAGGALEFTLKP